MKNVCVHLKCDLRPIARDRYNIFYRCDLSRPLNAIHVHSVLKYRHNTYRTFFIDLWEDYCSYLSGKTSSFVLNVIHKNIAPYTNVNHTCPYTDSITLAMKNFSSKDLILDLLLPAGQFRMDFDITESREKPHILASKIYFSVSDHRIWHSKHLQIIN